MASDKENWQLFIRQNPKTKIQIEEKYSVVLKLSEIDSMKELCQSFEKKYYGIIQKMKNYEEYQLVNTCNVCYEQKNLLMLDWY